MAIDPDIQKAQAYLRQLGYGQPEVNGKPRNLAVDGISGRITAAAMQKFREDHNLPPTTPMADMLKVMGEKIHEKRQETAPPAAENSGALDKQEIRKVQAFLRHLGHDEIKVDGINGKMTGAAIEKFRQEHGLAADAPMQDVVKAMGDAILEDPKKMGGTIRDTIFQGNKAGSDAVAVAQALLNLGGEFVGEDISLEIDGSIGAHTRAAYKTLTGQDAPIIVVKADKAAEPVNVHTEIAIGAAREGPVVGIAAGAATPGVAARDGVIPTIEVAEYTGARASPTPPLAATAHDGKFELGVGGDLTGIYGTVSGQVAGAGYNFAQPEPPQELLAQRGMQELRNENEMASVALQMKL